MYELGALSIGALPEYTTAGTRDNRRMLNVKEDGYVETD
jgi:hypothetical protein